MYKVICPLGLVGPLGPGGSGGPGGPGVPGGPAGPGGSGGPGGPIEGSSMAGDHSDANDRAYPRDLPVLPRIPFNCGVQRRTDFTLAGLHVI